MLLINTALVSNNIRSLRKEFNLSQTVMGEALQMTERNVRRLEKTEQVSSPVGLLYIFMLCDNLHVDICDFLFVPRFCTKRLRPNAIPDIDTKLFKKDLSKYHTLLKRIHQSIKTLRIHYGYSQNGLSDEIGYVMRTIRRVENGVYMSIDIINIYAEFFNVSAADIVKGRTDW